MCGIYLLNAKHCVKSLNKASSQAIIVNEPVPISSIQSDIMRIHHVLQSGTAGAQNNFMSGKGTHDIVGIVGELGPQIDVAKSPFQPEFVQMLIKLLHDGVSSLGD